MNTFIYASIGFIVGIILLPLIRYWGILFKFVDRPNHRKVHTAPIPALGGVAVFLGISAFYALLPSQTSFQKWDVLIITISMLFIIGLLDDKFDISSLLRLAVQLFCAGAIAFAGIKVESLHGVLGIYEIATWLQIPLTIIIIAGVTNAFNLIDGIDGLAGGLSFINTTVLSVVFYMIGQSDLALFCALISGVLFSFLIYNFHPAKIFMGDSGSLVLGFIFAVLGIHIITTDIHNIYPIEVNMNLVFGLLALPVFDTLRLFTERIAQKRSPFSADKNHIHHIILNKSANHMKASYIIYLIHTTFVITALLCTRQSLSILTSLLIIEYILCIFWYRYKRLLTKTDNKYLAYSEEDG
ncbi:glycosyltransferase family 4 protein [Fulvivirga sediminis]|uniref:Undecaprenyl/decaprenyl-phosphate alpha-N-acetylglucosaminyl 1-phosphate transferase n=1 Tax=Fulvivirga sediminis TaxID=2803949 RepID=A0A937F8Y0_9BACT|nr:MraY family glycosyltransferase [Fulvivirga sediminis]MBL3656789.1 undecaprenyl/decaprenyl-phosphate alpha-N-acetylglucosaminyl 1-phosphate transferase [Fulvivirga sediminis]